MNIKIAGSFVDKPLKYKAGGVWTTHPVTVIGGAAAPINTVIDSGPTGTIVDNTPTFTFHAENATSPVFQVSIDTGTPSWVTTTSPYTPAALGDNAYTFRVRAIEGFEVDPSPATRTFTVNVASAALDTIIDTGPSGTTTDNTPTFTYHAVNADQAPTYQRSLDTGTPAYGAATASTSYTSSALADGAYTFRVRAIDSRGADASPALRSITVSTGAPVTVGSIAALNTALAAADPGDVIYMADGTYGAFTQNRTYAGPPWVEVTALNPGAVTFQTTGQHNIQGEYLKVSRVNFRGEVRVIAVSRHIWIDHCLIDGAGGGGYMGIQINPTLTGFVYDTQITGCKFQGNFGEDALRLNQWADGDGDGIGLLIQENEITGVIEVGPHNDSLQTVWGGGTSGLVYRRNYQHDNRSQNFFVKDQNAPVNGIVCDDSLFVRNTVPSPGFGQPSVYQVFGPATGVRLTDCTIWGDGDVSLAVYQDGPHNGVVISNNAIYRMWTSTPVAGTFTNNTLNKLETAGGSWPSGTGTITTPSPGFNNPAADDYRILTGPSAGRGVSWRPADFHYGP